MSDVDINAPPTPVSNPRRRVLFIIAAALLVAILFLGIYVIAGAFSGNAPHEEPLPTIVAAVDSPTATPLPPTATPTRRPTNTAVVVRATETSAPTDTPVPATDTPAKAVAAATPTATDTATAVPPTPTPVPTELPNTGLGSAGLLMGGMALIAIILVARRLRLSEA